MANAEDMPPEEWRAIPGHPGYDVSSYGRVRSHTRIKVRCRLGQYQNVLVKGKVLSQFMGGPRRDYAGVHLWDLDTTQPVHKLVALAWHGPRPSKDHVVAHWSGNPRDNRPENLRWATRQENELDKLRHGTYFTRPGMKGEAHHQAKLTDADAKLIKSLLTGQRGELTRLSKQFGVTSKVISLIRDGKGWTHAY